MVTFYIFNDENLLNTIRQSNLHMVHDFQPTSELTCGYSMDRNIVLIFEDYTCMDIPTFVMRGNTKIFVGYSSKLFDNLEAVGIAVHPTLVATDVAQIIYDIFHPQ